MSRVRPFIERDRPVLEGIYRACRAEAAWLPPAARASSDFARDTEGETILVALGPGGAPEGFVSVWEADRFIHHLYVRSGAQRKGAGKALLDALGDRLPKPWRLKCLRANAEAAAFYLAQGWKEVSAESSEDGPYALLERA